MSRPRMFDLLAQAGVMSKRKKVASVGVFNFEDAPLSAIAKFTINNIDET